MIFSASVFFFWTYVPYCLLLVWALIFQDRDIPSPNLKFESPGSGILKYGKINTGINQIFQNNRKERKNGSQNKNEISDIINMETEGFCKYYKRGDYKLREKLPTIFHRKTSGNFIIIFNGHTKYSSRRGEIHLRNAQYRQGSQNEDSRWNYDNIKLLKQEPEYY